VCTITSLCLAVVICASLVNTHTHTYRQLLTGYTIIMCMTESAVMDICNFSSGGDRHHHHHQQQQQSVRGYLRTPSYPHPYSDTADCTVNLTAPDRGQRVRLYVVDFQLDTAGPDCADWLHVFDGLKSITLCGSRARRLLATSARQQLQVRFHSNQQHRPKGFWLYYEGMNRDKYITRGLATHGLGM